MVACRIAVFTRICPRSGVSHRAKGIVLNTISTEELTALGEHAEISDDAGAGAGDAKVLTGATVGAKLVGYRAVGLARLFDYDDGCRPRPALIREVSPALAKPAPAVIDVDTSGGFAMNATVADNLRHPITLGGIRPKGYQWATAPERQ